MSTSSPPGRRREAFSVVDRRSMRNLTKNEKNRNDEDAVLTAASSATGGSITSSTTGGSSSPRLQSPRPKRPGFLKKTFSQLSLFGQSGESQEDNLLGGGGGGGSVASITSFEMEDIQMTPFEMEMKAISLLTEIRKMIKSNKQKEKELEEAIVRHTDLALARNSGVGAVISMRKAKRFEEALRRVVAVIGYLETHEMDLMADIQEAKNALGSEEAEWPAYEDFKEEVEGILQEKEPVWSDEELLEELERLRAEDRREKRRASSNL